MPVIHNPEKLIRRVGRVQSLFLESYSLLERDERVVGVIYESPSVNVRVEAELRLDLEDPESGNDGEPARAHLGRHLAWEFRAWCVPGATDADRELLFEIARVSVPAIQEITWVPVVEHEALVRHRVASFAQQVAVRDAERRLNELFEPAVSVLVTKAGGVLPFQAEGALNGEDFYFRFRSHSASLRVGGDDPVLFPRLESRAEDGSEFFSGVSDMNGFVRAMHYLVPRLAPAEGERHNR